MIRLKHWLALGLFLGMLLSQIHAQVLAGNGDGNPPPFGVQDRDGFFGRNTGALKRISERIRKLEQEHGYRIFLVVEPVLIAATAPERASELRQAWVPDGDGLVVVFEADTRGLGIGRDMIGNQSPAGHPARVPSYQTTAIIGAAMDATDPKLAPDVYLETLMEKLAGGFDTYFQSRAVPPPRERSMKIGLLVAGTLALLGLGAIGLGGLVRHTSMATVRSFRFPVVDRPERLGAPCGGNVTARRFTAPKAKI